MGPIKCWLEGTSEKPDWIGEDDDVSAALHVDKTTVARLKGIATKVFACLVKPRTVDDKNVA